jgi:hypothetical protein
MTSSFVWKLVLAAALAAAILISAVARAPRRPVPRADLRALVLGALLLYAVGLAAALSHRQTLAALLYGSGITVSSLAGWLSRAADAGEPPDHGETPGEPSPPGPEIDWDALERQLGLPRRPNGGRAREHEPVA